MISRIVGVFCVVFAVLGTIFFTLVTIHPVDYVQAQTRDFLDGTSNQLPFSEEANAHMMDVRKVLYWARIFTTLCLIGAAITLSLYTHKRIFVVAGWTLVVLPLVLAIIPWNVLFKAMHTLLFPQGNWVFPANSLLIQTYPPLFFIVFAVSWGILSVVTGLLLLWVAQKVPA